MIMAGVDAGRPVVQRSDPAAMWHDPLLASRAERMRYDQRLAHAATITARSPSCDAVEVSCAEDRCDVR